MPDKNACLVITDTNNKTTCSQRGQTSPPIPPATWRTGRNICAVFDSGPFSPVLNMTSPTHRKYITYRVAVKEDWDTDIGNTCRKLGEIWTCGFWDMREDRQTDRQTRWSQYFAHLQGRRNEWKDESMLHTPVTYGMCSVAVSLVQTEMPARRRWTVVSNALDSAADYRQV